MFNCRIFACLLLILIWSPQFVLSKYVQGKVNISPENKFVYLSRFAYDIGDGHLDATIKLPHRETAWGMNIFLILDEEWDQALEKKCNEDVTSFTRGIINIDSTKTFTETLSQSIRPHLWYIVLSKCEGDFEPTEVEYELIFKNPGDSHFGVDKHGLLPFHLAVTVLLLASAVFYMIQLIKLFDLCGMLHPAIWLLTCACLLHYLHVLSYSIHLAVYANNGVGVYLLDICSELCMWGSHVILYVLFLCIGWGWTLTTHRATIFGGLQSTNLIIVSIALAIFQTILTLVGRLYDESHWKHHHHEAWTGFVLVFMRLGLAGIFVCGIYSTLSEETHKAKRTFLVKFLVLGLSWLLILPGTIIVASLFAPYYRHRVVCIASLVWQSLCLVTTASQFITKSEYFKLSMLSKNILTGSKPV